MSNFKNIIVALLTFLMLALYVYLVTTLLVDAHSCAGDATKCVDPDSRIAFSLNTVQGLVSALVISVLAISKPGQGLNLGFVGGSSLLVNWLAALYVLVWLLAGGAAYVYGQFHLPTAHVKTFSLLVDLGVSWFGLAIAAAYAYLGIKP